MINHERSHRRRRRRQRLQKNALVPIALLTVAGSAVGIAAASGGSPPGEKRQERQPTRAVERPLSVPASRAGGPVRLGFRDISEAPRAETGPRKGSKASTGTYTAQCGRNERKHYNADNFIVAPGVRHGAHHVHDYVGNISTDADSTDQSLATAGTTCSRGDKSTYFWPVLRLRQDGPQNSPEKKHPKDELAGEDREGGRTASAEGNVGLDGNVGEILTPTQVKLQFRGNAAGPVTAMPRFLRAITGDAKAYTNGPKNARANWTCTGFLNRRLTDRYPRCPEGSGVVRILDFPSCWDGVNLDSPNHRTHLTFPREDGVCAPGTRPVPQLRITLTYAVPPGARIALDTFPEQRHKPETDHADFANVMPSTLTRTVVECVNRDRTCG